VTTGLSPILVGRIARRLETRLGARQPGHCIRVDDLAPVDALAIAGRIAGDDIAFDVHVLAHHEPRHEREIKADRAIELRNRKQKPLLLLVPAGAGHAASSLDNSFEPLPLMEELRAVSADLEKELSATDIGRLIGDVKHVLGRTRQVESWTRFLGAVSEDPTARTVGSQLWQVGLVPDLGTDRISARLLRNAKAAAAISRPSRPTARVIERLEQAEVKDSPFRQRLQAFLEQQDAGVLADAVRWARDIGEDYAQSLTFDKWQLIDPQPAELQEIKVTPFRKEDGAVDARCKLRLDDADGQLYCDVTPDKPGTVVVRWTTEPAKTSAVAAWRVEVLPPFDLRAVDTAPLVATKVKGDKRQATLRVDVSDDDLTASTLFVVRVRGLDAGGGDLELDDGEPAAAESDQFEVLLTDHVVEALPRAAGAASLAKAVLDTAVSTGGDLTESIPLWDPAGQVFDVRIGKRRALIRVSRLLAGLHRRITEQPGQAVCFSAQSPLGEQINAEGTEELALTVPPAFLDARKRLLTAIAGQGSRDLIEVLAWDEELRGLARAYVQSYRRALNGPDEATRAGLLAIDTLTVRVGTAADEVRGMVLLPTHPLRLAWIAAYDQLLRGWAQEIATAGKVKAVRESRIDISMVSRLSPANLPFLTAAADGTALCYAEELTYGAALYLPVATAEPQSAADVICAAIDVSRDSADLAAAAKSLGDRIYSYRNAHPGTGTLRVMAINPGSGTVVRRALEPLVLAPASADDNTAELTDPQRLEIIAYSNRLSYTDPVSELRELQRAVSTAEVQRAATHLVPPLGLAARGLDRMGGDREGHHIAVVQDLAHAEVTDLPSETVLRATAFGDLLTPLASETAADDPGTWFVIPTLKPRGSNRIEADMVEAHRAHQMAVAASLGLAGSVPALAIRLSADDQRRIEAAHDRSDWVVTLDQGIGPEFFEDAHSGNPHFRRYLLDYAPDFLEGLGRKLAVTTTHHGEIRRILGDALRDLGIGQDPESVSRALNRLLLVSGRLALRLLRDTSQSVEAVSLAALMAHLDGRGQLKDRIVVPVDAHPEIFGAGARRGEEPARRCDILLVRVTQRSLRIECVEVKGRRAAQLPAALADDIVDQLEHTERVLQRQFFASDPPRVDGALQRAWLAGLLHYYAERSARGGLIDADRLPEMHRNIDRIEESTEQPEIEKTGYVISTMGTTGFPARHRGVPIKVLTADDLGKAGFTTVGDVEKPPSSGFQDQEPEPEPDSGPSGAGAEQDRPTVSDAPGAPPAPAGSAESDSAGTAGATELNPEDVTAPRSPVDEVAATPEPASVELGSDAGGSPVTWTVSTQGSPHAFILGIPGQGKSVTTRRIIREFAGRGLPSLIVDFHGDMAADPPPGAQVIRAADGLKFSPFELPSGDLRRVNETAWEVAEIIGYVCSLGDIQRNHVYEGLRAAYQEAQGVPTMSAFAAAVEAAERDGRGKNVVGRIRPLTDFGLFSDDPEESFETTWRAGAVIDLSGLQLEEVQIAAAAFVLRKVYREMFRWPQDGTMRLAVVLDEAHRIAKDVTLPKLMKEGRKFGISVVVASQGLADFHREVLTNAGTKIVFRTNYPESRNTAGFLRGREGQDLSRQIEQLGVGTAYVSTPDHAQARKVYMIP
jgi:DNA phosphorothioation-dependent restriction protein DptH